ncbi:hypothetical protein [Beggiatoa leptomitoformis]|uniref:Phage terminase large subunit n=1 Tax=Beggiatoa leptomitoformis TaxID=288004 RepID=A0A2N9YHJ9_9GAMM|nr:hypothetical protein [Beggiatoa leptomitoformis]ALG67883.1 hypothetical protein AL038_09375 [Beggiatoa leptomitoformis]AUI69855.1 hypothetical protein BLE401_14925 [Beggiatoa leptomitoformis]
MDNSLTSKEFLQEIYAISQSLRQQLEAREHGLDPAPEAIEKRRKRVFASDFAFFAYNYFPHHIRGEASVFQKHFMERFPKLLTAKQGCKEWWIAPRGEAKTSLLCKIGCLWIATQAIQNKDLNYIVLLGAEASFPAKLVEVIKTELCFNPALTLDFPEIYGSTGLWRIGEIITANNVKFESFGADQAIRGTFHGASRPKVIIGDDLITDKEAKSPTERQNRWEWYERAVSYLGSPDGSVKALNVATVLNNDDPVSRAKKSIGHVVHHFKAIEQFPERMELWEECERIMRNEDKRAIDKMAKDGKVPTTEDLPSHKYYAKNKKQMNKGAVISWGTVRSLYWLMAQRANNPKAFLTEMQGEPRDDGEKVFTNLAFWVSPLAHWVYFGACDPSMGKGEKSDPSAILIGGWDVASHKLHIIEAKIKRRVTSALQYDIIKLQRQYNCLAWAFENNNAYEYMRLSFIQNAVQQGVPLPLIGVTATIPAETRIASLEEFITGIEPRILFHATHVQLLDELDTFPDPQNHHHYDGLTALHLLWMIAVSRGSGVTTIRSANKRRGTNYDGY